MLISSFQTDMMLHKQSYYAGHQSSLGLSFVSQKGICTLKPYAFVVSNNKTTMKRKKNVCMSECIYLYIEYIAF